MDATGQIFQISTFPGRLSFIIIPRMFWRNLSKIGQPIYPVNVLKVVVFPLNSNATIFPIFFSVLYIRAKYCVALLNYFTKNVINSAIASYFVDVPSSNLLKFFGANKGHTTGNRQRE